MSLLIIRCPLKPFASAVAALPGDWQDAACAEQFEWYLFEDVEDAQSLNGVRGTESMPYADEALVLLPTLDVRLIEAKVPLTNSKKLQQILPNLIEDFVLTGVESIAIQALPPNPGHPALQRTIALIDKVWFRWLAKQLECLLAPRVRLIPDCLVLDLIGADEPAQVVYQRVEENIIFTQRTGVQLGVSWIEHLPQDTQASNLVLPMSLRDATLKEMSWDWLANASRNYLQINANSRSVNFALNLLPTNFRRNAQGLGGVGSSLTHLSRFFF